MRRKKNEKHAAPNFGAVEGERLDPVRVIERELVRPDGTTMKVRVPVYPPFQLKQRPPAKVATAGRKMRKTG
jgi:hypothetical protein